MLADGNGMVLADTTVTFFAEDGSVAHVVSDETGRFSFDVPPGSSGRIEADRDYGDADPEITASDALDVLRIVVGLDPGWGPAGGENYVAADIDLDGVVTPSDALEVLRYVVGLDSDYAPRWVFLDANADLSDVDQSSVDYATGIEIAAMEADMDIAMQGILLGNMESTI